MHIILMYDISGKNVVKMLKLCRRYLNWIQNSVFEGEISEAQLKDLMAEAMKLIDKEKDSLIIFKIRQEKWLYKEVLGKEVDTMGNIL
ncbi:MAG: CRISPR-associated endonuclease Cas2 [Flavobacteriaceae bacterium]|nr:CRISPR-associated endonuclease Cas2 [Flavobacteriaceae bacterium]